MLFEMIWTFFKIGLFTIGGGYAMIPLISQELVGNGWMTTYEVADVIAIAKMTPGPFAVNAATFAGMKIYGVLGAISCTFGVILPSLIVTMIVAKFFFDFQNHKLVQGALSGIRPVVVALIASAVVSVAMLTLLDLDAGSRIIDIIRSIDIRAIGILLVSLLLLFKVKLHPIWTIMISGALGIILFEVLPNVIL